MSARYEYPLLAAKADRSPVGRQITAALNALDWWADWSNQVAELIPEEYDGDEAQEAIILRSLAGLVHELEVVGRERDALAELVLALVAVDTLDEDGDCVYCRSYIADDEPHQPACPWARARAEVLPHGVRNGVVEHDTGPSGCCPPEIENPTQAQPVDLSNPLGVRPRDGRPAARAGEEGTDRQRGESRHGEGAPAVDLVAASEAGEPARWITAESVERGVCRVCGHECGHQRQVVTVAPSSDGSAA